MNERTMNDDLHRTHLYIVNGIIVDALDYFGHMPTVEEVKTNWQFAYNCLNDVSDDEIFDIMRKVARLTYHKTNEI